jgi:hypothetical protein
MRRFAHLLAAAALTLGAMAAETARAETDNTIPIRISEKIIAQLARTDLDAVANESTKYMGPNIADRLKNSFASIKISANRNTLNWSIPAITVRWEKTSSTRSISTRPSPLYVSYGISTMVTGA